MASEYRSPLVSVDIIIEITGGIVLIERSNPPYGWALPGGFVDYGESLEVAALREAKEETSLDVRLKEQLHSYSAPSRDPRQHTITTVFVATAQGIPKAADDAKTAAIFRAEKLPVPIVFDHARIIEDYWHYKGGEPLRDIYQNELLASE